MLFGEYVKSAQQITVTDPYIRLFFQARNLMAFLEVVASVKADDEMVDVHLITVADEYNPDKQLEYLEQMQLSSTTVGINFTWEFDSTNTIHARHIVTDHGWKISLDRGLDIFQQYDMNDAFTFANRLQQYRTCKAFEMTVLQVSD